MEQSNANSVTEKPVLLKTGYFKLNMNYIPFLNDNTKEKFVYNINPGNYNRNNILRGNFYIKSSIDLLVKIGPCDYILDKGEYFFYRNLFMYHEFSIVTNTNDEDVIIYHDCEFDIFKEDNYWCAMATITRGRELTLYNSLHSANLEKKDDYVICSTGMIGTANGDELNEYLGNNINYVRSNSSWLHLRRHVDQERIKLKVYYLALSADMEKLYEIIDDKEVNDLLVNRDMGVTLIDPPMLGIRFTETNYAALKELLDEKYGFNIKPIEKCVLCNFRENADYDKLVQDIIKRNNEIEKYEKAGIFTYEIFKEIPFTYEFYKEMMSKYNDTNTDLQKYL